MDLSFHEKIALGIIFASFISRLFIFPVLETSLWWDEAVYIGLAKGLSSGHYSLDPEKPIESFRPLMIPFIIFLFGANMFLLKILFLIITAFSAYAVFGLGNFFDKKTGLLTALFLSTSTMFVFFSSKLFTEPLFIFSSSFSLLFFMKWNESRKEKFLLFSAFFLGLSFLTRYFATVLVFSYIITISFFIYQKNCRIRDLFKFLLIFALTITPFFAQGIAYYQNPLGAYTANLNVYLASAYQTFGSGFLDMIQAWNYLTVFIILFFIFFNKAAFEKRFFIFTVIFLLVLIFYFAAPHKEPRYFLSFLPVFCIFSSFSIKKIIEIRDKTKFFILPAIFMLSIATLFFGVSSAYNDNIGSSLTDALLYLKNITSPDDKILTQSYPFVYAIAERKAVPYCGFVSQKFFDECQAEILRSFWNPENISEVVSSQNIKYILSYKFEPANKDYAIEYLEKHFKKIKTFEQWGEREAVVIYVVQ